MLPTENKLKRPSCSIAILPFENLSDEQSSELFCRSFTAELRTELSKFRQIQVTGYFSSPNPADSLEGIGPLLPKLQTDFHLAGSFRKFKDQFRINVQLFESKNLQLVWANRYEDQWEKLFDVYDLLLLQLVAVLQENLNIRLISQVPARPLNNLSAYEAFLYGMDELRKGTLESDLTARKYFQSAIEKSPEYSYAYSGMSLSYFNEWSCQLWERWEVSKNGAFEWASKAIELDEYNYIASYVLGRVFLYEGAYESSEYFLRKSLQLNGNDTDYLVQIATCFVYLGHLKEAWELYQKALLLNPLKADTYQHVGLFILVEQGKWQQALEIAKLKPTNKWVDYQAILAAIYFHLQQMEQMQAHWSAFVQHYKQHVKEEYHPAKAVAWLAQINPYRGSTTLEPFWKYISQGAFTSKKAASSATSNQPHQPGCGVILLMEGWWEIGWEGQVFRFKDAKGFHDIRKLVAQPGEPVHCAELMGTVLEAEGQMIIDERAKKEYKGRIAALQQEIEEAEMQQQYAIAERLQQEYEELIDFLSKALGLQGKSRKQNSTLEKARSAVTWRIRSAISKIEQHSPALGRHLANSVKTGYVCSYQPERYYQWEVN